MDNVSLVIQTAIVVIIIGFFLIIFFVFVFYRGKKHEIVVLNKRSTYYQGLSPTRSKQVTVTHYTVDCLYENSSKVHTLGCSLMIYDRLKVNKSYTVTVKWQRSLRYIKIDYTL